MANSKSQLKRTLVDVIRHQEVDARRLAGLDRVTYSGISSLYSLPAGSGIRDSTGNQTENESYLKTEGDTMVGAIAFFPSAVTVATGAIDISKGTTNDYSSYVSVLGEGSANDNLDTITGAQHAGQLLYVQAVLTTDITLTNSGNIITPDGADYTIADGTIAELLFDVTANKWRVIGSGGGTGAITYVDENFFIVGSVDPTRKVRFEVDAVAVGTTILTVQDGDGVIAMLDNGATQATNNAWDFNSDVDVIDTNFAIQGSVDNTRELRFETDGIAAGTKRTWTAQDASGTVPLLDGSAGEQVFSNGIRMNSAIFQYEKGSDEASATELTLSGGNVFDITGTTTINTIDATGWEAGAVIILQFDGALTVTHNSGGTNDIMLADNSNMTTAAGDVLTLFFDGTDWIEVSRATSSGGSSNVISQGDSNITVTDVGVGAINVSVDATAMVSWTVALGMVMSVDIEMAGNDIDMSDGSVIGTHDLLPENDDDGDLGSASLQYRNLYIDGTANIDVLSLSTAASEGVGSHLYPTVSSSFDLGSATRLWTAVYTATFNFGVSGGSNVRILGNTGGIELRVDTSDTVEIFINNVSEYIMSASTLDMQGNTLTDCNGITIDAGGFVESFDSQEIGFSVSNDSITVGTEGTMRIPEVSGSPGTKAAADTDFGNVDGCIGIINIGSGTPSLIFRANSGQWFAVTSSVVFP